MPNTTQGHEKVKRRLEEVFNNEVFKEKLNAILQISDIKERMAEARKLAEEYSIDSTPGSRLSQIVGHPALSTYEKSSPNLLEVIDQKAKVEDYLSFLQTTDHPTESKEYLLNEQLERFPVHLAISPQASKRDVLDFINKNWAVIKHCQDQYSKKLPEYRTQKNKERDDFIWENRHMDAEELSDIVNDKFSGNNLIYSDINKIIHQLKKRRTSEQV